MEIVKPKDKNGRRDVKETSSSEWGKVDESSEVSRRRRKSFAKGSTRFILGEGIMVEGNVINTT